MNKFVLIGGGENGREGTEYETKKIDEEIIKISNIKDRKLKFLFLAHGNKYEKSYFEIMKKNYEKLNCDCNLLEKSELENSKIVDEKIKWADIIYVGGGNTLEMIKIWKDTKFDNILKKYNNSNKIYCGISAGAICWCKYGVSDSNKINEKDEYINVTGLNYFNILFCPSYNERKQYYNNLIKIQCECQKPLIALEKGTAIVIEENKYRIVKSIEENKIFKITKDGEIELKNKRYNPIEILYK